jgi:hypothetical protein
VGGAERRWVYSVGLLVLLLGVLTLAAAGDLGGLRYLISSGGGRVSQDGLTMQSAIGQPVAGRSGHGPSLCSGFLCGAPGPEPGHRVFLPLVTRGVRSAARW